MQITSFGVGNMGGNIANCLMKRGFAVTAWDRSPERVLALRDLGAKPSSSAHEAVREADVVITSLLGDSSVLDSVQGEGGFLSAMKPGAIHLCVTTVSPECADQLSKIHSKAGTRFVAGPVIGRPESAATGQLTTFLAGDASAIAEVRDMCTAYAQKVIPIEGRAGLANSMKLCVNYTAISIIELMGEIYAYGEKVGIDKNILGDFFSGSFNHPALKTYAVKLRDNDTSGERGFAMVTGLKDVNLMLAASSAAGVKFDIAKIAQEKMLKAIDAGMSQADWSAISQITRKEAGLL